MEIKRDAYLQQLTHKSFTVIISFTKRVKAVIKVKTDRYGLECVENKFLKLPNVQKYEVVSGKSGISIHGYAVDRKAEHGTRYENFSFSICIRAYCRNM